MVQWENNRVRTAIESRKGGPGNPWLLLDTTDYEGELGTPSGGGRSVESKWGRTANGERFLGSRITSDLERVTFDVMLRRTSALFLSRLGNCPVDIRARLRCGDMLPVTNLELAEAYMSSVMTSRAPSAALAANLTTPGDDITDNYSFSAGVSYRYVPVAHTDITGSVADTQFNKIIAVGLQQCAGDCGGEITEEQRFFAVTNADTTPGYQSTGAPLVYWTLDGGGTWDSSYVDVMLGGNITDIAIAGDKLIVVSPQNGVAYARIQDIYDEVATPWTLITTITSNFPQALASRGSTVFAAGAGGYIYRSTDGGATWSTLSAGAHTTQTINSIAMASENLAWFAGNAGALVKYLRGALSLIVVVDTSANILTANINVVAVPEDRNNEVFLGTAGGEIWRSDNARSSAIEFSNLTFMNSGSGAIDDLQFIGYRGDVLFALQSNADGYTRVLRDLSGGYLRFQEELVGDYTNPNNFGINSIAPVNANFALTVGNIHETYGFIGKVSQSE